MRLNIERSDGTYTATSEQISLTDAGVLKSERAQQIISILVRGPEEPTSIARALGIHEQGVYYHLRRLERAGIIRIESAHKKRGVISHRYDLSADAYTVLVREPERSSGRTPKTSGWLEPFITSGRLEARIIVGSPDPHGPQGARSRDGYYGMDLALFLGTFITEIPTGTVMLDTEARNEDLARNLIVIGGPIVNAIAERINSASPIRFDTERKRIVSTISSREYLEEATGVVSVFTNPIDTRYRILWVYGLRNAGTRAAIIAFLTRFTELSEGNTHDGSACRVVNGLDLDSDGIVDSVSFAE
jgi:DNA-binding transcriptional ArsR family regulator